MTKEMKIREVIDSIKDGIIANINKSLINGETEISSMKNIIEFAINKIIEENYNVRDGKILRDFYNDKEKMNDFTKIPKDVFLKKYPSISEEGYNDTAFLYTKNELENKLLDTLIEDDEDKSLNTFQQLSKINKTIEEYNENNPFNVQFSKDEIEKIKDTAESAYREMKHEQLEDNISSSFNNLLNFINNGKCSKFNTQKNGMIIEKGKETNCIFFTKYDEENREDDGVMSIFGTKDNITKYLSSLKDHLIEILWSDGLTDEQNKTMIKEYENQIDTVLEDIRVPNSDPNKIYFIYEEDNNFELKTAKETEEELNKIENKISQFVNEETKENQRKKSYEEEM